MDDFLDLLLAYHHWCVRQSGRELGRCTPWLAALGIAPPDTDAAWGALGTTPVSAWGLVALPAGWGATWKILSPRERTLTVEALEYLEEHRPGAVAAALTPAPPPKPAEASPPVMAQVHETWSLADSIACLEREVARREREYPLAVERGEMTPEHAARELGEMRAAHRHLRLRVIADPLAVPHPVTPTRDEDDPRQSTLF